MSTQSQLDRTDPLTLSEEAALVESWEQRSTQFLLRAEAEREARARLARERRRKQGAELAYEI